MRLTCLFIKDRVVASNERRTSNSPRRRSIKLYLGASGSSRLSREPLAEFKKQSWKRIFPSRPISIIDRQPMNGRYRQLSREDHFYTPYLRVVCKSILLQH